MPDNSTAPLEPDTFYHIFNRGNGGINIFYKEKNYRYFMTKYDQYMSEYLDTYCYCLLPNHFHLLVRIKPSVLIEKRAVLDFPRQFSDEKYSNSWAVSERFRQFFMSYAKSINQQEGRTGSLFQKDFRRQAVDKDDYFTSMVWYIHNNPVHHGIHADVETYPWSSYQRILITTPSKLMKEDVIAWFGSRENYVACHRQNSIAMETGDPLLLE